MKCHYEVLGIAREAEDSEIKKAYRKLALQWHPDKNLDNEEKAREQFQLIQQAYEVLSDPHERAWYDNHREQILRGRNSDYEDNCLDVFQYFTVTCFKGYGDDPGGFYAVYSEIFKKIAAEDAEFMDDEELEDIPEFGDSQSNYEQIVGPFYAHWQSYCTKRTYSWLCKYNISEIKDRRILREIEKETKKLAQKARKERNEEVRNLVSFVKKRDKRVEAYRRQLEEKAELNRKKQEQNRLDQIRKRNKELEEMKKSHAKHSLKPDDYEEQLRMLEQEYGGSSEEYSDEEEDEYNENLDNEIGINDEITDQIDNGEETDDPEEDMEDIFVDDLYCVACDKSFKNKKALKNHQTSQKHINNVEKVKAEMIEDDKRFNEQRDQVNDEVPVNVDGSINGDNESNEDVEEMTKSTKKSKKNKKSKKSGKNSNVPIEPEVLPDLLAELEMEKNNETENKKSNKKGKNKQQGRKNIETSNIDGDVNLENIEGTSKATESITNIETKDKKIKSEQTKNSDVDTNHVCVTCKAVFQSKNKLFNHLKETNHGVYIPKVKDSTKDSNSKSSSNKKNKRK
ncbi:dnaJ homolog subfamily C member 21 [Condylostylus longicornis]|uniref:dnaJ homolog subfamily C member 21 n=1 Tax=Condylostylus longicornis TaxID=2530218 RepID=UPI00244DDCB3|nr:dnaJ homolog subfamily C member 21 [Condylostylus longicornis]